MLDNLLGATAPNNQSKKREASTKIKKAEELEMSLERPSKVRELRLKKDIASRVVYTVEQVEHLTAAMEYMQAEVNWPKNQEADYQSA